MYFVRQQLVLSKSGFWSKEKRLPGIRRRRDHLGCYAHVKLDEGTTAQLGKVIRSAFLCVWCNGYNNQCVCDAMDTMLASNQSSWHAALDICWTPIISHVWIPNVYHYNTIIDIIGTIDFPFKQLIIIPRKPLFNSTNDHGQYVAYRTWTTSQVCDYQRGHEWLT